MGSPSRLPMVCAVAGRRVSGCVVGPLKHRRRFDLDEFVGGRVAVCRASFAWLLLGRTLAAPLGIRFVLFPHTGCSIYRSATATLMPVRWVICQDRLSG